MTEALSFLNALEKHYEAERIEGTFVTGNHLYLLKLISRLDERLEKEELKRNYVKLRRKQTRELFGVLK